MVLRSILMLSVVSGIHSAGERTSAHAAPTVRVELSSAKNAYLLGEPVQLKIALKNAGREPLRMLEIHVENTEPEIKVYTSDNGRDFVRWELHILGVQDVSRELEWLRPGGPKTYALRVLYSPKRENQLAFHRAGRFWLKVDVPFIDATVRPYQWTTIHSDTIEIDVEDPRGEDATLWKRVQERPFLIFLQTGGAKPETASKAAELLSDMPDSGYADALRYSLTTYYNRQRGKVNRDQALRDPELQQLRAVLGITEPPEGPFPEDERLDRPVTIHAPRFTPLEEVVEQLSRGGSIKLSMDPALRIRRMHAETQTKPLRKFMDSLDAYKAVWIPDGDGYRLVPD